MMEMNKFDTIKNRFIEFEMKNSFSYNASEGKLPLVAVAEFDKNETINGAQ